MNIIAAECAVKKHHPEWSNVSHPPPWEIVEMTDDVGKRCIIRRS
jgi:hypothetical protein